MKTLIVILTMMLLLRPLCADAQDGFQPLTPKEYSEQHIIASNSKDPNWTDAVSRLAKLGDDFTVQLLERLDTTKLNAPQKEVVKSTLAALRTRMSNEDGARFTKSIQLRLERAAWADLSCNPLETRLVPWTLDTIRKRLGSPGVVEEVKRIESHYVPSADMKTLFSSMRERVPLYATRILAAPNVQQHR